MCYSGEAWCRREIDYAMKRGDLHQAEYLIQRLAEIEVLKKEKKWFVSGFAHPELLVFTNEQPVLPQAFKWGLIPYWSKSMADAKKAWNQTLNARGETIFEKPAFRNSAKKKRCLIYLDAFYEHHHAHGRTYPFRISMKDGTPMAIAGLWESWIDKQTGEVYNTCSIVTTKGNALMSKIHNNPKAELGPRMPVIFTKETQDEWLIDCRTEQDEKHIQSLIKPLDQGLLEAHSVGTLLGKQALGNVMEVEKEMKYPELDLKLDGSSL
jgi:putative SOS response-associated peptidase YedK